MNQIATVKPRSIVEVKESVNVIQALLKDVMKEGVHFGTIPGCGDKPALLKAGAEKILTTFRLVPEVVIDDQSNDDECRYRVSVKLFSNNELVGVGVGECSSSEEKYKWRSAVCDEEYEQYPETKKRLKWKKGWNGSPATTIKQVRTEIADIRNTVLKMAKKRSLIDGCLTTTAASDIFTQDVYDDLPEYFTEDNRSSGVKAAESARTPSSAPESLILELEEKARQGMQSLIEHWKSLTETDRKSIGSDFGRIKKIAESANAG